MVTPHHPLKICRDYSSPAWCWWDTAPGFQKFCIWAGGVCCAISFLSGCALFLRHACSGEPRLIKMSILRIIAVVPLFSLDCFVTLVDAHSPYHLLEFLHFAREISEGVVVVAFVHLIVNSLGGPRQIAAKFGEKMQSPRHPIPLCLFPTPFHPGYRFIAAVLRGILQFALVMVVVTGTGILLWSVGLALDLEESTMSTLLLLPKFIKSLSSNWALYGLAIFYVELLRNEELKEKFEAMQPELKFISLKGVIILPASQFFAFSFLAKMGLFNWITWMGPHGQASPDHVGAALLSVLVSFQNVIFSTLYWRAYPVGRALSPEVAMWATGDGAKANGLIGMFQEIRLVNKEAAAQRRALSKLKSKKGLPEDEVTDLFTAFAVRGGDAAAHETHTLSEHQFRYVLEVAGIEDASINELVNRADFGWDRRITLEEFKKAFSAKEGVPDSSKDSEITMEL